MKRRSFSKIITSSLLSLFPNWALGKKVSVTLPGRGCWKARSLDEYLILEQADVDAGARFLYFKNGPELLEGGSYFKVWPEHPRYEEAKTWPFDIYKRKVETSSLIRDMEEVMGDWRNPPQELGANDETLSAPHPEIQYRQSEEDRDAYWADARKDWSENNPL